MRKIAQLRAGSVTFGGRFAPLIAKSIQTFSIAGEYNSNNVPPSDMNAKCTLKVTLRLEITNFGNSKKSVGTIRITEVIN